MERLSKPFNGKNYWRKKGYNLLDGSSAPERKIKVVQIKGSSSPTKRRRFWRIKKAPKLRYVKNLFLSPRKLWQKFNNGYINMMLRMAGKVGHIDDSKEFETKKIPQARKLQVKYKTTEDFEARLVLEIYKALQTSRGVSEVV